MRKNLIIGVVLLTLAGALLVSKLFHRSIVPDRVAADEQVAKPEAHPVAESPSQRRGFAPAPRSASPDKAVAIQPEAVSAAPIPVSQLSPRQLIEELAQLGDTDKPITPEQAARFKQTLEELAQRGAASVPAIREYLEKNADVAGAEELAYPSLRASLIDTLKKIGGSEAQAAMVQVMQITALPAELLALANGLEQEAPGQYREQILSGARETLAMATANQLGTNVEVGPAFRMLQNYGSGNTTEEAASNDPQQFYNAVALANMPNGQGLQSLIQMAQGSGNGSQTIATEMIAQLAGQNSQAMDALTQMAQGGQISQDVWVKLAPILAGDQYQIGGTTDTSAGGQINIGGQNFSLVDGATTPDQISQRMLLINKLLGYVPGDSAAAAALRKQLGNLGGKLVGGGQSN